VTDAVAKAVCEAAGRSAHQDNVAQVCAMCDPVQGCTMWPVFRFEAQQAIAAAYRWHREHRR
jgi:hypothetical protein